MTEYKLKYGCNPNQNPARIHMDGKELPFEILNGAAGYINLLDAFNSWQLVRELKEATGLPSAASFKHVSPAGAAVAQPLSEVDRKVCMVPDDLELSPIAQAYVRARGCDRVTSFGDFVALSDECDASVAKFLVKEVSDGIIAPSYSDEALEILKAKRRENYLIIKMNPDYQPEEMETKQVFGIKFEQKRNDSSSLWHSLTICLQRLRIYRKLQKSTFLYHLSLLNILSQIQFAMHRAGKLSV